MLERIFTRRGPTVQKTGTSAIAAGLLLFASVFAEYLFSAENDGKVTNVPVLSLYIAGFIAGTAALIVALNGLRVLPAHASLRRAGRVGFWAAIGGATLLLVFAAQALVTTAATGDEPGGFVIFGLGFLLLVGGQIVAGFNILRAGPAQATGRLLLLASAAAVIAVAVPADPFHDLGLFLFDAAWIGIGLGLLRPAGSSARRRRMLGWSVGVGLLLALTGATGAFAGGPPVVKETTAVVNELEITSAAHPCTGQPAQWTIINNGTIRFTAFADGTAHFTGLLHLTLVIDLLDPVTGLPDGTPDATGTATDAFGGNGALNEDGTAFGKGEQSFALNGRGTNADGSRFTFHASGHHVFDSAGNAKLDLFRAHCG
jgi:hypothetical protein